MFRSIAGCVNDPTPGGGVTDPACESADTDVVRSVRAIAENDPSVDGVARLLTMQLGPHRVLLNIDVQFRPHLSARELFDAIDRIEGRVRRAHPEMQDIFVEIEALRHAGQANR